jgi:hypothetical protein
MRKLIKQILEEYSKEFFEIKPYCSLNDLLFEEIRPNQKEIAELGYEPKPISDDEENMIKSYLSIVNGGQGSSSQNLNPKKNGILGIYRNKNGNETKVLFKIRLTRHWYFRLHRTEDPKFKFKSDIIDPKPFECIDAIDRNADRLARFVIQRDPSPRIVWEANTTGMLSFLMVFEPTNAQGTEYNIVLTNQIKGVNFYDRVSQNKIPLR